MLWGADAMNDWPASSLESSSPQRVRVEAAAVVLSHVGGVRAEVLAERLDVARPVGGVADVVEDERHAAEAEPLHALHRQLQHLQVDRRIRVADGLDTELVELAEASGLRAVVPEHGAEVVEPHRQRLVVQPVFQVRAADCGCPLRTECDLLPAAVFKAVHLLLDDVRLLADGAGEERRVLEDGRVDAGVAERPGGFGNRAVHERPVPLLLRQGVGCSSGGLVHRTSREKTGCGSL